MFLYLSGILVIPNISLDTTRKNNYYQFLPSTTSYFEAVSWLNMMVFILLQCRNVGKMGGKPDYSSDVRVYRK